MTQWKKFSVGAGVGTLVFVVAGIGILVVDGGWERRRERFERAGERGMAVVAAIDAYAADHGAPPPKLNALVPRYLPQIPKTGLRAYPEYEYRVFTNRRTSLAWYDLGSRGDRPMAGLWVYSEGDPGHAILALKLDQSDRVIEARLDRMPKEYERQPFDAVKWKQGLSRIEMARALTQQVRLEGATLDEVRAALGEPAEVNVVRDAPWELRIDCGGMGLNWDVFFYWPSEHYPRYIYGGVTERIGRWAYVHE